MPNNFYSTNILKITITHSNVEEVSNKTVTITTDTALSSGDIINTAEIIHNIEKVDNVSNQVSNIHIDQDR